MQTAAGPTDRTALAGQWVREEARVTVDPEPAWQRLGIDGDVVTRVRATRPELVESYRADGTERAPAGRRRRIGGAAWCGRTRR